MYLDLLQLEDVYDDIVKILRRIGLGIHEKHDSSKYRMLLGHLSLQKASPEIQMSHILLNKLS